MTIPTKLTSHICVCVCVSDLIVLFTECFIYDIFTITHKNEMGLVSAVVNVSEGGSRAWGSDLGPDKRKQSLIPIIRR